MEAKVLFALICWAELYSFLGLLPSTSIGPDPEFLTAPARPFPRRCRLRPCLPAAAAGNLRRRRPPTATELVWYVPHSPFPFRCFEASGSLLFFRVLVIAVWFLPWYGRRSPSWSTLLPVPPDVLCPALCSRFRRLDWGSYLRSNSRVVLGFSHVLN